MTTSAIILLNCTGCIWYGSFSGSRAILKDPGIAPLCSQKLVLKRNLTIYNRLPPDHPTGDEAFGGLPFVTFTDEKGKTEIITAFPELKRGYYVLKAGTIIQIEDCWRDIDHNCFLPVHYELSVLFTVPDNSILEGRQYTYIWGGFCTMQRAPWEGKNVPKSRFFNPFIE